MKKLFSILLAGMFFILPVFAEEGTDTSNVFYDESLAGTAVSVVLMEKETGTILYEKNPHEQLPPASVTKIMTLLLCMEALDDGRIALTDMVTASSRAVAMGGTQIYLEEGEQMSVDDLIKSITVSSANDAAVAMGEYIAGSETAFVAMMNQRAKELGMNDTNFVNCTGLDDTDVKGEHVTSAYDIAVMSRELLRHELIKNYTTIWMDSVRNGEFGLANTNKLISQYPGATGIKTGFTSKAGHCLSASAMRDGMELIAVIMGAETSNDRFETAKGLLDYGFANYTLADVEPETTFDPVTVILGEESTIRPVLQETSKILINKSDANILETTVELVDNVSAPVEKGQKLGMMTISANGKELKAIPLVASEAVEKLTFGQVVIQFVGMIFMAR